MKVHHEHVLLHNEFKDDRHARNMVKCQNTQCDSILCMCAHARLCVCVCVCVCVCGPPPPHYTVIHVLVFLY